jgi:hypothetical protein
MPKVKQKKSLTIVLASQMKQLIKHKNKESINQYTKKRMVIPTQGVCALEETKKRVFKHSEVVIKDKRLLEKRKAKKNHIEVGWKEKNVKNLFIIKK